MISAPTVARRLSVSEGTVRMLCRRGVLRCFRLGERGHWRIDERSVDELLERWAS